MIAAPPVPLVKMVITDLTRMQQGRVCIAGYDTQRRCIRPVLPPPGIAEHSLIADNKAIAFPFAVIELDLLKHTPQPPHCEDWRYDYETLRFIRVLEPAKRQDILRWSLFHRVADVFEQLIHDDNGHYVMDGAGSRSLGTIIPQEIKEVVHSMGDDGGWNYRLIFNDDVHGYRLKITDLTWNCYCNSLRNEACDPGQIADAMTFMLKRQGRKVYLRIGLSRGWAKFPDRCFLQINAIHTFPDYLEGKTFADFRQGMENE